MKAAKQGKSDVDKAAQQALLEILKGSVNDGIGLKGESFWDGVQDESSFSEEAIAAAEREADRRIGESAIKESSDEDRQDIELMIGDNKTVSITLFK